MKIKKDASSYADYKIEVSYGQLVAIRDALTAAHAEPMADEILQEINFYLENVPGPGESKEEFEQREETGKSLEDGANLPPDDAAGSSPTDNLGVPSAEGEDDFAPETGADGPMGDDPGEPGEMGEPGEPPVDETADVPVPPAPEE